MILSKPTYFFLALLTSVLFFNRCTKEEIYINGNLEEISFSVDTLIFDTVFTERGSATYSLKIKNGSKNPIILDEVGMEAGSNSKFRLNVDGVAGKMVNQVEILSQDSIYVFAEVTIDPDQPLSISPFIIEENLVIKSGTASKKVLFQAWGQNANYFPYKGATGEITKLPCKGSEVVWDDPKPYVVYGVLWISDCNLVIPAGTQIYVHGGITQNDLFGVFNDGIILVDVDGRITIEGSKDHPVVIQGDRLEPSFEEEAGQWWGIYLSGGSRGNQIRYATIKNSNIGIYADSAAVLSLANTRIRNTAGPGLYGVEAKIRVDNTLIHSNYATGVYLTRGGDYTFNYCTIASYGVDADALSLSNYICIGESLLGCEEVAVAPLKASFTNSIIAGSRKDELVLKDISLRENQSLFDVNFDHCALKITEVITDEKSLFQDFFESLCESCLKLENDTPLFKDIDELDFRLDSLSAARGAGIPINNFININIDIDGNPRDASQPSMGCFEN